MANLLTMIAMSFILPQLLFACQLATVPSSIQSDEVVRYYPTYAFQSAESGDWTARIHGSVFEPETGSIKRRLLLAALVKLLDLDEEEAIEENATFRARAAEFLVDNERGKDVAIRIGQREVVIGTTGPNGQFRGEVKFTPAEIAALAQRRPAPLTTEKNGARWLSFAAVLPAEDERHFTGRCQLIPPEGTSVISDIDDTIKQSDVADKKKLLANTFLRPFEAVPGMAKLYEQWERSGVAFHYLTASPWQLHVPLEDFRAAEKFPAGTWHMKTVRWKDSSLFDLFASPETYKPAVIEQILADFPQRKFILVGDSGERDPEIYGGIARKFPKQIERIYIREALDPAAPAERYAVAFDEVPREKWQVFHEAKEIAPQAQGRPE